MYIYIYVYVHTHTYHTHIYIYIYIHTMYIIIYVYLCVQYIAYTVHRSAVRCASIYKHLISPPTHYSELCAMLAPITDEVLEEHISAVLVNKDLASTSLREEGHGGAWRGITGT